MNKFQFLIINKKSERKSCNFELKNKKKANRTYVVKLLWTNAQKAGIQFMVKYHNKGAYT